MLPFVFEIWNYFFPLYHMFSSSSIILLSNLTSFWSVFFFFFVTFWNLIFNCNYNFYFCCKSFRLAVLADLHILGCHEHNLSIFGKCLSTWMFICVCQTFYDKCNLKTNAWIFMKLSVLLHPNINCVYQLLVKLAPKMELLFRFFQNSSDE